MDACDALDLKWEENSSFAGATIEAGGHEDSYAAEDSEPVTTPGLLWLRDRRERVLRLRLGPGSCVV